MAFTPIRPVPSNAPRPQVSDLVVLRAAISAMAGEYAAWAKGRGLDMTPEAIAFAAEVCLKQAREQPGDLAWNAAKLSEAAFGLPGDGKLVSLLETTVSRLKLEWELITRKWVVESGYRIPADQEDKVEVLVDGAPMLGRVEAISKGLAVAYVRSEDQERLVRVYGEDIIGNLTQGRLIPEYPVLGSRYVDAPALAAAAEKARPKTKAKPAVQQDDALSRQQRIADAYRNNAFGIEDGPGVA